MPFKEVEKPADMLWVMFNTDQLLERYQLLVISS